MINLVLSGGGVRGFAHLGVMKAFLERGVKIRAISGTSSGALSGAFIAAGFTPDESLQIMKKYKLPSLLRGAFNTGIFSMKKFEDIFTECFPDNSFSVLNIPLYISCTNLYSGKTEFFSKGELIPPLLASCSLPVIFTPKKIDDQLYVDGGILNNLPVEPFVGEKGPVVGVHVNPVVEIGSIASTVKIMERSLNMAIYGNVLNRIQYCNLLIEPHELARYSVYEYSKAEEIFSIGYNYGKKKVAGVLKLQSENS